MRYMFYGNRHRMFRISLYRTVDYMWEHFEDILMEHMELYYLDKFASMCDEEQCDAIMSAIINYLEYMKEEEMEKECPTDDNGFFICNNRGDCCCEIGKLCDYSIMDVLCFKWYYDIDKLNQCISISEVCNHG